MHTDVVSSWLEKMKRGLRALEQQHQRRTLVTIQGVNFCSSDYLGISEHPALRAAIAHAVQNGTRVAGTASRLLAGQAEEWHELEEEFARFAGTESALYFSSGYAANIGLLASLIGPDDVVYSDELNHASLIDGMRLSGARKVIYPHLNLNALEDSLRQDVGAPWRRVIVTESVFSMDGDIAPLKGIAHLADKYGAAMIVDEAHATGVHGESGRGLAAQMQILPHVLAVVHTCGKALASAGAFVCGSAVLKEHLINHARTFIFSTALPPYFAEQVRTAVELAKQMDAERVRLLQGAGGLIGALRKEGFDTMASASQIVPVVLGRNEDTLGAAAHLQLEGFAVRAIRPPTVPVGRSRLRLSLTTKIADDDLRHLVKALVGWRDQHSRAVAARHS